MAIEPVLNWRLALDLKKMGQHRWFLCKKSSNEISIIEIL